jgi:predicted transcriptional regulator
MINWDNPRKRRDRLYIIAEILDIAKDGALKTQIMYKANLSFAQLNSYLKLLMDTQLLEITTKDRKRVYKTTKKGVEYMDSYREIIDTLNTNGNPNTDANGPPNIKGGPTIYWVKKHY